MHTPIQTRSIVTYTLNRDRMSRYTQNFLKDSEDVGLTVSTRTYAFFSSEQKRQYTSIGAMINYEVPRKNFWPRAGAFPACWMVRSSRYIKLGPYRPDAHLQAFSSRNWEPKLNDGLAGAGELPTQIQILSARYIQVRDELTDTNRQLCLQDCKKNQDVTLPNVLYVRKLGLICIEIGSVWSQMDRIPGPKELQTMQKSAKRGENKLCSAFRSVTVIKDMQQA
jgi:hypothetical protein